MPPILQLTVEDLVLLSRLTLALEASGNSLFRWPGRRSPKLVRALLALALPVEKSLALQAAVGGRESLRLLRAMARGRVVFDPFMGAGTIPVEASRLGYTAIGYDINPNAVLVSRVTARLCTGGCSGRVECLWEAARRAWREVKRLWCIDGDCIVHILLAKCPPCLAPRWVSSRRGPTGPRAMLVLDDDYNLRWINPSSKLTPREPSITLPRGLPEEQEGYVAYAIEVYNPTMGRRWISLARDEEWSEMLSATAAEARRLSEALPDIPLPRGEETRRLYKANAAYASKLYTWRQLASLYYFISFAARCREEAAALVASQAHTLSLLAFYYQPLAKMNPGMIVKSYWIPRNPAVINPYATTRLPNPPDPGAKPLGRGTLHSKLVAYTRNCASGDCTPPILERRDSTLTPPPMEVDLIMTDPPYPGLHTYRDTTFFYTHAQLLAGLESPIDWKEIDPRSPKYTSSLAKALLVASSRLKPEGIMVLLISSSKPEGLGSIAEVTARLHDAGVRLARAYPIVGEARGRLGRADSKAGFILVFTKAGVEAETSMLLEGRRIFSKAGLKGEELEKSWRATVILKELLDMHIRG